MADDSMNLGIRFTERDINTAQITTKVQKAIDTAIANVNLDKLKEKFNTLALSANTIVSSKTQTTISKRLQSAVNKVVFTLGDRQVKTQGMIDKLRKGVNYAFSSISLSAINTILSRYSFF